MQEQRRHQRIRFAKPQPITLGFGGAIGPGVIENISLSGLMVRTALKLEPGKTFGCEFSLFGSPLIDVPALVVNRIGDLFGAKFQNGPVSGFLLDEAIEAAVAEGKASIVTVHEAAGRKSLRLVGGVNAGLHNDVLHALTRVGIDEIDASRVTAVDQGGIDLCILAVARYGVSMGEQSSCFAEAYAGALKKAGH